MEEVGYWMTQNWLQKYWSARNKNKKLHSFWDLENMISLSSPIDIKGVLEKG